MDALPSHPVVPRHSRLALCLLISAALALSGTPAGASCSSCRARRSPSAMCSTTDIVHTGSGCGGFSNCQNPTIGSPAISILPQGGGSFTARMSVTVTAPWNQSVASSNPNGTLDMTWFDTSSAPTPWTSGGNPSLCEYLASDRVDTYVEKTGLTCSGAPYSYGTYSLRASTCGGPCPPPFFPSCGSFCGRWVETGGMDFTVTAAMMGCPTPKKWSCPDDASCSTCGCTGGASGAAGGGPGVGPGLSGPGATLRYAAGGAGGTGFPGTSAWTPPSAATGRTTTPSGRPRSGTQQRHPRLDDHPRRHLPRVHRPCQRRLRTASPSDEKRNSIAPAPAGSSTDSTAGQFFDSTGLWTSTPTATATPRWEPTPRASSSAVAFPDGRSETFTYSSGKLATIVEPAWAAAAVPGPTPGRGNDLTRIDRPDGPAWEFHYDATNSPAR